MCTNYVKFFFSLTSNQEGKCGFQNEIWIAFIIEQSGPAPGTAEGEYY